MRWLRWPSMVWVSLQASSSPSTFNKTCLTNVIVRDESIDETNEKPKWEQVNNNVQVLFLLSRNITKEVHHQVKRKYGTYTVLSFELNKRNDDCLWAGNYAKYSLRALLHNCNYKNIFPGADLGHFKRISEKRLGGDMNTNGLYKLPHHFTEQCQRRIWTVHNKTVKWRNQNHLEWPFQALNKVQMLKAL